MHVGPLFLWVIIRVIWVIIRGQNYLPSVRIGLPRWKMVLPSGMKRGTVTRDFRRIFGTFLRQDGPGDGGGMCVRRVWTIWKMVVLSAKWKMGPFLGQKRPMFAPPPSVWGNPWNHFSPTDFCVIIQFQILLGAFLIPMLSRLNANLVLDIVIQMRGRHYWIYLGKHA